jgi:hypothetical protein
MLSEQEEQGGDGPIHMATGDAAAFDSSITDTFQDTVFTPIVDHAVDLVTDYC